MSDLELPFDRVCDFFAYASERENIRIQKENGFPKPWTDDPIMRTYRFCNVFREDDVVTKWVHNNIRLPYWDHPNLWLMLAIARTINLPSTLEYCFGTGSMPDCKDWQPNWLTRALNRWQDMGNQVYTGAYMIRAESDPNKHWYSWRKNQYVAEVVIGRLWNDRREWMDLLDDGVAGLTLERVWDVFQSPEYVGWGPFMAYEVVTDMRHTRYLRDAPDRMTWANPGPGAARGICRILGLPHTAMSPGSKRDRPIMMEAMRELLVWSREPSLWPHKGPWEMREVEHTLCEFDKYERVRLNQGRPRAMYNGEA